MSITASVQSDSPPAADVTFVSGQLRPYLAELLASECANWARRGAPWRDLTQPIAAYLNGGKALRPRFCYWGHASTGATPSTVLLRACAALELLHAFALIHDDLMDQSSTRRGRPVLRREIAGQHRQQGWVGDPDAYGNAIAMLTGDLAFALASRLATALPEAAHPVWARMVDDLTVGQFLDLTGAARQDRSVELARATTLLKSGQYTVTGPLRLGAAVAGNAGLPPALERYGDLVGEAFQLRDDLLGVFGDPRQTGKPVGEDLTAGKPTQLLAYAATMMPASGQALLGKTGSGKFTAADAAALTQELITCGARSRVERQITCNVSTACAVVDRAGLPQHVATALRSLATAATDRQE